MHYLLLYHRRGQAGQGHRGQPAVRTGRGQLRAARRQQAARRRPWWPGWQGRGRVQGQLRPDGRREVRVLGRGDTSLWYLVPLTWYFTIVRSCSMYVLWITIFGSVNNCAFSHIFILYIVYIGFWVGVKDIQCLWRRRRFSVMEFQFSKDRDYEWWKEFHIHRDRRVIFHTFKKYKIKQVFRHFMPFILFLGGCPPRK